MLEVEPLALPRWHGRCTGPWADASVAAMVGERVRSSKLASALAELAPALLVVFPAIAWVWDAVVRASWASLGRDQGIFQYVAWAVSEGDVAYRDVRDVNGPVVTIIHAAFLGLGGAAEHRFRVLDLACTGLSFAIAGALVPSILGQHPVRAWVRAGWAAAAWILLTAQYCVYGFWDTAQRESFLDWFVLVSFALSATHHAEGDPRAWRTKVTLAAAGFLAFVPCLGKPTYAIFALPQLVVLAIPKGRLRRVAAFLAGGSIGIALPLAYVARAGDLRAWARITFVDVPAMYRFIWPRPPATILAMPGYGSMALTGLVTTAGLVALVALRRLPLRALPIALMPVLGVASVVVQAKGFPYHFHPVTLGYSFAWIVAVVTTWQLAWSPHAVPPKTRVWQAIALSGAILVGARAAFLGWAAPYPPPPAEDARDPESLDSASRLAAFDRVDYFPRAMRDAAAYVAHHTRPDERVQTYGMDAYLLFLARRKSATPYIYAYDLNADAALRGSFEPDGPVPNAEQSARIRALRDEHEHDLLDRMRRSPPGAFVFVDRSPLMTSDDAFEDFGSHCPEAAVWVASHYRQAAEFEGIRVWLPQDEH